MSLNGLSVAIVGAGAVGSAIAFELSSRGASVTLIERDSPGAHASGYAYGGLYATAGAGIPGAVLPVAIRCLDLHRSLAERLRKLTGIDVGFRKTESIELARTPAEREDLVFQANWQLDEGFEVRIIDAAELIRLEPEIATGDVLAAALHSSHYEVDSLEFTKALAAGAERQGARLLKGSVASVEPAAGRTTLVRTQNGETISADVVVAATGPWSGSRQLRGVPQIPVRPVKGEILRMKYPGESFRRRVAAGGFYMARKPDGLVWTGSTEEPVKEFDERPSEKARAEILDGIGRLCPALAKAEIARHTACLRPVSFDGMPVMGRAPGIDGLWIANGAGKKGILLSPAMAIDIADAIEGKSDAIPAAFSIERLEAARG